MSIFPQTLFLIRLYLRAILLFLTAIYDVMPRFGRVNVWRRFALGMFCMVFGSLQAYAERDFANIDRLMDAKQYGAAQSELDIILEKRPKDARARFLKGLVLIELQKKKEALALFLQLTVEFPELPEPYNNLAVLYADQGAYDKAKEALIKAINTHPTYATAHENLGDIYAKMASQAYSQALQLNQSNMAAQAKLALIRKMFVTPPVEFSASSEEKRPADKLLPVASLLPQSMSSGETASAVVVPPVAVAKGSVTANVAPSTPAPSSSSLAATVSSAKTPSVAVSPGVTPTVGVAKGTVAPTAGSGLANKAVASQSSPEAAVTPVVTPPVAVTAAAPTTPAVAGAVASNPPADSSKVTTPAVVPKKEPTGVPAAAKTPSGEVDATTDNEVRKFLQGWANAWSAKNWQLFVGFYDAEFKPVTMPTRKAWEVDRQKRITTPKFIEVVLEKPQIKPINPTALKVTFVQNYRSDQFKDRTTKTLFLRKVNNSWKIIQELTNG